MMASSRQLAIASSLPDNSLHHGRGFARGTHTTWNEFPLCACCCAGALKLLDDVESRHVETRRHVYGFSRELLFCH